MMGYLVWFNVTEAPDIINSPYNKRVDNQETKVVRGDILAADGSILATTETDEDGNETRSYPFGKVFCHVVGLSSAKSGIEGEENYHLLSEDGNVLKQLASDATGQKAMGNTSVTTLDVDLQEAAYKAIGSNKGAVIVMEPSTGKILAMVSKPDYDPNDASTDYSEWLTYDSSDSVLLNRATQGLYPPGSTFKMLTVLEYMKENPNTWQDYVYNCNGSYQNGDYTIKCYHGTAHGAQNLIQAFANSCNGAFAEIGMQINSEKFRALANQMLFNSELPYTLPYNQSTFSLDGSSDDWEKLQTAIGQGKTQITPLHNLMIVSAIANGGTLMKPYMIDHVENVGGQTVKKFLPSAYGTLMSANDAQFLTHLMSQVVEIGTGSAMRGASYTVAGKTGSAEFETGKETHSWFVGFAPADKPKVAICVLAEESGSGGAVAAPIARQVLDRYFAKYGQ